MATKKTAKKVKVTTKKNTKKNVETLPKLEVKLVSYEISAVIPTMMYGNIQPKITVEARTMEDAKRAVMPHIEELYATYCEKPRDGSQPAFMSKAKVTSTEKIIPQNQPAVAPKAPEKAPESPVAPAPAKIEEAKEEATPERSPAFIKAENAIKAAMSMESLNLIEEQIQKSTKIDPQDKPVLLTEVLKKRKEF